MKKIISLSDIDVTHSPVVRAEYRHEIAEEYADQYRLKKHTMPLAVLFQVGKSYLIGDGLHRINGMKMAGLKQHVFEIAEGTKQDCLRFALLSNVGHGIRRTNADKRHCVTLALKEFNGLSFSVIADYCAVAHSFVSDVHKSLVSENQIAPTAKRKGIDGKERTVNLSPTRIETQKTKEISEKDTSQVPEKGSPASENPIDETGVVIPDKAINLWARREAAAPFIECVEGLKLDLESLSAVKDPIFTEVNFKMLAADLANVRAQLLLAIPYAVCPACQAKLPESCKLCLGRGMVSKWRYETSPIELRKMREAK